MGRGVARILLELAKIGMQLPRTILRAQQRGARQFNIRIASTSGMALQRGSVECGARVARPLFRIGNGIFRLAPVRRFARRRLIIARALAQRDLRFR